MKDAKCRVCHVQLTETNWSKSATKGRHLICKQCRNEQNKQWRKNNYQYMLDYHKVWAREHSIKINGKSIASNQIHRPKTCSICGREAPKANLHYWSEKPLIGLWVCLQCHGIIHLKGYFKSEVFKTIDEWIEKYQKAKQNPFVWMEVNAWNTHLQPSYKHNNIDRRDIRGTNNI